MKKTPGQRLYSAIDIGDALQVSQIIAENPSELYPEHISESWLHKAAWKGKNSVIDAFLAAGVDINLHDANNGPPLEKAVSKGQMDTVRHLISRGANVNLGRELIAAINSDENSFELVKLLVESGTDVNRWWYFGEPKKGIIHNALSWAVANAREDIADYLRAHGAVMPAEGPSQPSKGIAPVKGIQQEVIAYFEEHFGPVQPLSLVEIVPSEPAVAVHMIPASKERNHITLFTTGMAFAPMKVPKQFKEYKYAELFIQLPADWPYADIADPNHGWPVQWLRMMAAHPHETDTWLRPVTVVANDPPEPIAPNAKFTSMLLLAERTFTSKKRYPVQLYRLTPLYPEERDLEISQGIDAVMRAFDEHSVPFIVDLHRRNVAVP